MTKVQRLNLFQKQMSRYNVLKKLDNFNLLISLGVIPINILDWIVIYEYYLSEREYCKKMQSYSNAAENYKISEKHTLYIVSWMEGC